MATEMVQEGLILASSSPRRRALLREAGLDCRVVEPDIREPDHILGLPPVQQAEALAYFKARTVQQRHGDAVLLGADTIVWAGGQILGKPRDGSEARSILQTLSGTTHEVITGVALLGPGNLRIIASEITRVTMRPITPQEIEGYIESGEWQGKAGAYAIQETGDRFIECLDGSFTNVVGLPIELVKRMLVELRDNPELHRAQ